MIHSIGVLGDDRVSGDLDISLFKTSFSRFRNSSIRATSDNSIQSS
jgi:hypothetical protein